MSQMNAYNKTSEKELNKIETSNLLDAEFKTLVIRMLDELRGKVDEFSDKFNKEGSPSVHSLGVGESVPLDPTGNLLS